MRLAPSRPLLASVFALGVLAASGATAAEPSETRFFLRQTACAQGNQSLATTPGSGETQCGFYTLPLNEALVMAGDEPIGYTYATGKDGVPLVLDADRDLVGQITAGEFLGGARGVGQSVVDIVLTGQRLVPGKPSRTEELVTRTLTKDVPPLTQRTVHTFTVDLPAALDGQTFTAFAIQVTWRGLNVNQSQQGHNGSSWFEVPTTVE